MEAIIYPNVIIGDKAEIGLYAILGEPPCGFKAGEIETRIGSNATIRSHAVIYAGNVIGNNFQTGHHVMIREKNEIADYVSVGSGTVIEHHVRIGNNVRIHSQTFIPEYCILEEGCWLGPNIVLTNAKYPNRPDTKKKLNGVRICRNAVIGANTTVLPGICIGEEALIGAGSVVVRDIAAGMVAYGNPAVEYRKIQAV